MLFAFGCTKLTVSFAAISKLVQSIAALSVVCVTFIVSPVVVMPASPDLTVPFVGSAYTVDTLAENSVMAIAADNLAFLLILGKLIKNPSP